MANPHNVETADEFKDDQTCLESIDQQYFEESFDGALLYLEQFCQDHDATILSTNESPSDTCQMELSKKIGRLSKQLAVVEKRLYSELSTKQPHFELSDHIAKLNISLHLAVEECGHVRTILSNAKFNFVDNSLQVLALHQRCYHIHMLSRNITFLSDLHVSSQRLDVLLQTSFEYVEMFDIIGNMQNQISFLSTNNIQLAVVDQIQSKLRDILDVDVQVKMSDHLKSMCSEFNGDIYANLMKVYVRQNQRESKIDELLRHFTNVIHSVSHATLLSQIRSLHQQKTTENVTYDDNFSISTYSELCATFCDYRITVSNSVNTLPPETIFTGCLNELCSALQNVMVNYKSVLSWHSRSSSKNEEKKMDFFETDIVKFESSKTRLWADVQSKVRVYIEHALNSKASLRDVSTTNSSKIDVFLSFVDKVHSFISQGEELFQIESTCHEEGEDRGQVSSLKHILSDLCLSYLETYHNSILEQQLKMYLSSESWSCLGTFDDVENHPLSLFDDLDETEKKLFINKKYIEIPRHPSLNIYVNTSLMMFRWIWNYMKIHNTMSKGRGGKNDEMKILNKVVTFIQQLVHLYVLYIVHKFVLMKDKYPTEHLNGILRTNDQQPNTITNSVSTPSSFQSNDTSTTFNKDSTVDNNNEILEDSNKYDQSLCSYSSDKFSVNNHVHDSITPLLTTLVSPLLGHIRQRREIVTEDFHSIVHDLFSINEIGSNSHSPIEFDQERSLKLSMKILKSVSSNHSTPTKSYSSHRNSTKFGSNKKLAQLFTSGKHRAKGNSTGGVGVDTNDEDDGSDIYADMERRIVACESVFALCFHVQRVLTRFSNFQTTTGETGRPLDFEFIYTHLGSVLYRTPILSCLEPELIWAEMAGGSDFSSESGSVGKRTLWCVDEVQSEHNAYVDILLNKISFFISNVKFCIGQTFNIEVDQDAIDSVLQSIYDSIYINCCYIFVEGFSDVKRCSNEGRALMQLDFTHFNLKLNTVCGIFQRRPDIQASESYVLSYIKGFYMPQTDLVDIWISKHRDKYTKKQLDSLISCVSNSNAVTASSASNALNTGGKVVKNKFNKFLGEVSDKIRK